MAIKVTLGPVSRKGSHALPPPDTEGGLPLHAALAARTSVREYGNAALTLPQVSQLLWAAQGITHSRHGLGMRTAPSAGGLYPMEVHLLAERVERLERGTLRYRPPHHDLERISEDSHLPGLGAVCFHQDWMDAAPVAFVIGAVTERTSVKYGDRAKRYILIEAGHIAQNIELQAVSLGLGAAVVGAFHDDRLAKLAGLPKGAEALYVVTVGPLG